MNLDECTGCEQTAEKLTLQCKKWIVMQPSATSSRQSVNIMALKPTETNRAELATSLPKVEHLLA